MADAAGGDPDDDVAGAGRVRGVTSSTTRGWSFSTKMAARMGTLPCFGPKFRRRFPAPVVVRDDSAPGRFRRRRPPSPIFRRRPSTCRSQVPTFRVWASGSAERPGVGRPPTRPPTRGCRRWRRACAVRAAEAAVRRDPRAGHRGSRPRCRGIDDPIPWPGRSDVEAAVDVDAEAVAGAGRSGSTSQSRAPPVGPRRSSPGLVTTTRAVGLERDAVAVVEAVGDARTVPSGPTACTRPSGSPGGGCWGGSVKYRVPSAAATRSLGARKLSSSR